MFATNFMLYGFFIFYFRRSMIDKVSYFFLSETASVMSKGNLVLPLRNRSDQFSTGISGSIPRVLQELPNPPGAYMSAVQLK